ncbi:protein of unknown function [Taphrina deformans PYCC 5710]|uniref:Uncharacterized protein n=1 Tax=Taphrina deformans (strain PYCC 5710 / ATCC 11124 / CBS 356.35 / IMI 108563 / JCM 9778 / NBRC 8474) TaxID=1097556 RepID=R4XDX7_TAPDE|nr:protein of unknown function [Taphrina deformans PYCC 5710]|eukprot:CCG84030.1 protein of unknown function [Taphrina deformans PYCC 5710]
MEGEASSQTLFKKSTRPKKATKVRLALGAAEQDEDEDFQEVFKPKKSGGFRSQITKAVPTSQVERKSIYSNDYLSELRHSTPTIPRDFSEAPIHDDLTTSIANEEEHDDAQTTVPKILDESTIRHVKEQRDIRRRAGENFIPLADALDVHKSDPADRGKRLQTEDVVDVLGGDGTEGLDGYESDSLPIGARNMRNAEARKREEMEILISERQEDGGFNAVLSSEESNDSDDEWERTQTGKTGPASARASGQKDRSQPPILTPIPTVQQSLDKLRQNVEATSKLIESKQIVINQLEQEELEIAAQEEAIKNGLQRANLAFETAQLSIGGLEVITRQP